MDTSTSSFVRIPAIPPVLDAEADQITSAEDSTVDASSIRAVFDALSVDGLKGDSAFPVRKLQSVVTELCAAVRSALDDERDTAEDSLRRATEILRGIREAEAPKKESVQSGGLAPWQIRKVTSHVEANLDATIRNEDLAAIARLNPSHFGRVFRNSFGVPPHEYVIRRRVERAQGLMLTTAASLSEIALDCGLADQSHLTRLFRRLVGESPRAWRRARLTAPA
ncbi:AraC-like DNA-binding protein [Povalibacter uvarum]|uniref:AraC-like DNA-binding protein n=1 Tax=Povalibacter uvarum TaxID=732238 RepID=A0A841HML1_9GAMM|nr:AraC family transcriptional regulator [Povalibacter uvarum]MBB6093983.1 AraC-like DNA-binding protein [Povalibacter uvarum]